MQPEVADVFRHTDTSKLCLSIHQQKTIRALQQCRTAELGGHVDACDSCGNISISYNSCRNRHCPKCQGHKRVEWIQKREQDLLPCTYYHVVFTLPQELNALALHKPAELYDTLFTTAWDTLHQFGKTAGVQLGMVALLHTWGQNLSLHPHLHCIVPGGGVDAGGNWQKQLRSNKYLFSVKALSKVFRAIRRGGCAAVAAKKYGRPIADRIPVCQRVGGICQASIWRATTGDKLPRQVQP